MDYHNAMTPPSSVSPREPSANGTGASKSSTNIHPAPNGYDFPDPLRSQYGSGVPSGDPIPPLPLKPQPYSAAAAMHHAATTNQIDAYGGLDQSQYFPHHAGFHLYHKNTPTSGWYSTPS